MDGSLLLAALSVTSLCLFWTLTAECVTLARSHTRMRVWPVPAVPVLLRVPQRWKSCSWSGVFIQTFDTRPLPSKTSKRPQSTGVIWTNGEKKKSKLFDPLHICTKMQIRSSMEGSGYWEMLWNKLLPWSGNWWSFIIILNFVIIIKGRARRDEVSDKTSLPG